MNDYPNVFEEEGLLSVKIAPFGADLTGQPLEMVLDFNQFGKVIGIEVISLFFQAGKNSLGIIGQAVRTDGDGMRYSYDGDSDSFYLRLKSGKSVDQKALQGSMFLDDAGQILGFSAEWQ